MKLLTGPGPAGEAASVELERGSRMIMGKSWKPAPVEGLYVPSYRRFAGKGCLGLKEKKVVVMVVLGGRVVSVVLLLLHLRRFERGE